MDVDSTEYYYGRYTRSYLRFQNIFMGACVAALVSISFSFTALETLYLGWSGPNWSRAFTALWGCNAVTVMTWALPLFLPIEYKEMLFRNEQKHLKSLMERESWSVLPRRPFPPFVLAITSLLLTYIGYTVLRDLHVSLPPPEQPVFTSITRHKFFVIGTSLLLSAIMLILTGLAARLSKIIYNRRRPTYALAGELSAAWSLLNDRSAWEDLDYQERHVKPHLMEAANILDAYHRRNYQNCDQCFSQSSKNIQKAIRVMRGFDLLWNKHEKRADLRAEIERAIIAVVRGQLDKLFSGIDFAVKAARRPKNSSEVGTLPEIRSAFSYWKSHLKKVPALVLSALIVLASAKLIPQAVLPDWLIKVLTWLAKVPPG